MAYNPYNAIKAIYNYKEAWDTANKSGDTQAKNKAAQNAQVFYNQLKNNGHGNVAKELSSLDVSGAKYILDQYSAKNTGVDNPAYNTSMQGATDKNNKLAGYVDSDRKDVQGQYHNLINYANSDVINTDVTKTDAYKCTYDKMMAKYDLSALQGRNNAVASGGASNGGNIDSYAAANAMRQQAALTAQGQVIAHQAGIDAYKAGLDAYNARVSNVANILNQLGVYNSGTYDAMKQTIANDANIGQAYFENSETAKNNEVARQEVLSNISGTVGDTVTKLLNSYTWNSDGSLKNSSQDFQANINNLEKALASATSETERARILEQLRIQEAARNQKIDEQGLSYGKTYKYQGNTQSEAGRQFDKQDKLARDTLATESADNRYAVDAEKEINADKKGSTANLDYADIVKMLKQTKTPSQELIDAYNALGIDSTQYTTQNPPSFTGTEVEDGKGDLLGDNGDGGGTNQLTLEKVKSNISEDKIKKFIDDVLKPYEDNGWEINEDVIEKLLVGRNDGTVVENSNSKIYNIDVEDARKLCNALGLETDWIDDKYTNRTWFNAGKGMKSK